MSPRKFVKGEPRRSPLQDVPGGDGRVRPRGTRERPEPETPCGEQGHWGGICACTNYGAS